MITAYRYSVEQGFKTGVTPFEKGESGTVTWTDIEEPGEEEVDVLSSHYQFHPLAIEDCIHMKQRAKFTNYGDYVFIVLHAVESSAQGRMSGRELGIFVGHNYIVTFHRQKIEPLTGIRERLENNPELLAKGVDYILYLIIDAVIDEYFPVLDHIDERFSYVEDKLLKSGTTVDMNNLFKLKRLLVELRKVLSPHREMINALIRFEGIFIKDENRVYYLDIYDHLMRMFDFMDTYRDLISSAQEIYLTVVSNRMNEVMKTLTIAATIMFPLTVISGIYGMNFRIMPELEWKYGYLWALGLMAASTTGLIYYFRRKNWF